MFFRNRIFISNLFSIANKDKSYLLIFFVSNNKFILIRQINGALILITFDDLFIYFIIFTNRVAI